MQIQLGSGLTNFLTKFFNGTQKAWDNFLQPAVNAAPTFFRMVVGADSKNPKFDQNTRKSLKTISGRKVSSLTHMHGIGLRSKVF